MNKKLIAESINPFLLTKGLSQKGLSKVLGISDATLSQMRAGNHNNISDEMWRLVAKHIGIDLSGWQMAEIDNFKIIQGICTHAQSSQIAKMIVFEVGHGKSFGLSYYAATKKNVYYLQCERYFSRKVFLSELAQVMGLELNGTVAEMIKVITNFIKKQEKPLIILDEYDKIADKSGVFDLFKTFYDATLDNAGWVLCGANSLEKVIQKNIKNNKISYREIFSRVGKEYIGLKPISANDVRLICKANSINAPEQIEKIRMKMGKDGDLRALKNLIIDHKKL